MTLNGAVEFEAPMDDEREPESSATPNPWAARIVPVNPAWCTTAPPRRAWLLRDKRTDHSDGVLPLGKVGQLVSEGGGGKTMALIQCAIAVATGTPWLGVLDIASPGRVLAALGEEDTEEIHRRVYAAARATNAPTPAEGMIVTLPLSGVPSPMIQRDGDGNPTDAPFLHWLRGYLRAEQGWRLIILDPLSRFAGLDAEKDNALATRFVEAAESLAVQTGATVLVAHHSNQQSRAAGVKMTASSSRGVTGLVDGVRWSATLAVEQIVGLDGDARDRLGEVVTLAFAKSNYSRRGEPIMLRRDLSHSGALVPLDDIDAELVDTARRAATPAARREADREARTTEQRDREDAAIVDIVSKQPALGTRELRGAVMGALKIGREAADNAIARGIATGRLVREGSKHAGYEHRIGGGSC